MQRFVGSNPATNAVGAVLLAVTFAVGCGHEAAEPDATPDATMPDATRPDATTTDGDPRDVAALDHATPDADAGAPDEADVTPRDDADVLPDASVLAAMRHADDAWIAAHPSPASDSWDNAVYVIGLMAHYRVSHDPGYLAYAQHWAEHSAYGVSASPSTSYADNQCAGQVYLEIDDLQSTPHSTDAIIAATHAMVIAHARTSWTWVDAVFMAMPVFARLGARTGDAAYLTTMHDLYVHTRDAEGGPGLFDADGTHLFYRDLHFLPPYTEPDGHGCFWARGNGWALAALARVLDALPASDTHRAEYQSDFRSLATAVASLQRSDGFWNVSLEDPTHFGGPETSSTALFTYGIAWGMRHGLLDRARFGTVVTRAWHALATVALQTDGTVGWVQGVGSQPSSSQPVTARTTANFGVGAFLLAGSEVATLGLSP